MLFGTLEMQVRGQIQSQEEKFLMAVTKGASQQVKTSTLRQVLFVLSIGLCLASFYFMLDFQTSAQAKLSGELILGQVDSVTYNHQGSPIISFLFEYFGALSYFLALMIVYLGYYLLLRPVDIWHADFYRASLRVLGFDLSLIGLCALGSLLHVRPCLLVWQEPTLCLRFPRRHLL